MTEPRVCKHCGCELLASRGDECESRIGWCALIAARLRPNDVETQLVADGVAEFSRLDDERKSNTQKGA